MSKTRFELTEEAIFNWKLQQIGIPRAFYAQPPFEVFKSLMTKVEMLTEENESLKELLESYRKGEDHDRRRT